MGMLGLAEVRYPTTTFKAVGALMGVMSRKDWEESFGAPDASMREIWKWWATYSALVIPAWDGVEIVGAFLITSQGDRYLPLVPRAGTGFAEAVSVFDDLAVVVDDIRVAVRYNLWAANEHTPMRMVVPYGVRDNARHFSAKRLIYWSSRPNKAQWLLRAMSIEHAQIYSGKVLAEIDPTQKYPAKMSANQLKSLFIQSPGAHRGLALLLLRMDPGVAKAEVAGSALSAEDRARIIHSVQGEDALFLERILAENIVAPTVTWDAGVITETLDGWHFGGRRISGAILRLDTQQQLSGDLMISGSIVCDKTSYPFKEKYSVISKNPGNWIKTYLITRGKTPYIEPAWNNRLYEIARRFHPPSTMTSSSYGWSQDVLMFPNFCIDAKKIYTTQGGILGPQLGVPNAMAPADWDAFKWQGFCKMFLVLLYAVIRGKTELPPQGILLCNEPHIIDRLSKTFSVDLVQNPTPDDIDLVATNPLPLLATWTSTGLRSILNHPGHKNLMLSVDSHTARLASILTDWIQLSVEKTQYDPLRGIFLIIPELLKGGRIAVDPNKPFRSLATIVDAWVMREAGIKTMVKTSGFDLDTARWNSQTNSATKVMGLIHYGISRDVIRPTYRDTEVLVSHDEFGSATSSMVVNVPHPKQLTARLAEAKFLVGESPGRWHFGMDTWNLNKMLAMTVEMNG
jgi:hypothetical protein